MRYVGINNRGKALRKHSLHVKTAASVLLKLFISSNEWCHTTDAPERMSGTPFSNVNNIHVHSMIPEDQKNMTTTVLHVPFLHSRISVIYRNVFHLFTRTSCSPFQLPCSDTFLILFCHQWNFIYCSLNLLRLMLLLHMFINWSNPINGSNII